MCKFEVVRRNVQTTKAVLDLNERGCDLIESNLIEGINNLKDRKFFRFEKSLKWRTHIDRTDSTKAGDHQRIFHQFVLVLYASGFNLADFEFDFFVQFQNRYVMSFSEKTLVEIRLIPNFLDVVDELRIDLNQRDHTNCHLKRAPIPTRTVRCGCDVILVQNDARAPVATGIEEGHLPGHEIRQLTTDDPSTGAQFASAVRFAQRLHCTRQTEYENEDL